MAYFLTYVANILIWFGELFYFVNRDRCFIRDGTKAYSKNLGINPIHTTGEVIGCYAHWFFMSWLVIFTIGVFVLINYLRAKQAHPFQITLYFIAFDFAMWGVISMVRVNTAMDTILPG